MFVEMNVGVTSFTWLPASGEPLADSEPIETVPVVHRLPIAVRFTKPNTVIGAPPRPTPLTVDNLQLEVVMRADALEVGDRIGGLIKRIPATAGGQDLAALAALVQELKSRFPQKTEASVLAEPDTPYDSLVQVMDVLRSSHSGQGATLVTTELFPDISIGDAPRRQVASIAAGRS